MKTKDLLKIALKNLYTRKLRTFLTVLGVIIGCASIVVMVSLGNGITKSNEDFINSMGSITQIKIYGKSDQKNGRSTQLTEKDINNFRTRDHVEDAFGVLRISAFPDLQVYFSVIANRRYEGYADVMGIDPKFMESYGIEIEDGRYPTKGKLEAVYGSYVKESFGISRGTNYQQKTIDLKKGKIDLVAYSSMQTDGEDSENKEFTYKLEYAGETAQTQNWDVSNGIFIPIDTARDILLEINKKTKAGYKEKDIKERYSQAVIEMDDMKNVKALKDELVKEGYEASAMTDWIEDMKKSNQVVQLVLGGIGAVSLFVAAIGISNTMVMSMQERTREIGIMKVIGASINDIKKIFLTEASFIGLFGGILGMILSFVVSFILNNIASSSYMGGGMGEPVKISIITPGLVIVAIAFTTMIGLLSGYFPAKKAMRISALDAMRYQ